MVERVTAAQAKALEAVEAGTVSWGAVTLSWWDRSQERYMHRATMAALTDRGLIGRVEGSAYLTAAGHTALEHYRSQR
jgi:hypothetical protein